MDDDMANLLVAQLLYLDSVDTKSDITMYVNSPGGSVTAGEYWPTGCTPRASQATGLLSIDWYQAPIGDGMLV